MLGSTDATKMLLSHGAWPMYKCKSSGSTPLHIVASTGSIETLMILVEAMPNHSIDTRDQVGYIGRRIAVNERNYKTKLYITFICLDQSYGSS